MIKSHDNAYLDFMRHIQTTGIDKEDRTGTGTRSVFGYQMRFNLQEGFPLLTTKKVHTKSIIHELLWFLAGDTNIKYLKDNGVSIWDEWADEKGELGPIYGYQWRSWPSEPTLHYVDPSKGIKNDTVLVQYSIDQISKVLDQLRNNPDSRRLIVSAWNPAQVDQMKLPPCHALFQFYTRPMTLTMRSHIYASLVGSYEHVDSTHISNWSEMFAEAGVPERYLDCQLYQRSADAFLGVPFNIASYALLTHMIAQQVNMVPGEFIWTGGDCHLYANHFEQASIQLAREPYKSPKLVINRKPDSLFDYKYEDFEIKDYYCHPAIKASVAV